MHDNHETPLNPETDSSQKSGKNRTETSNDLQDMPEVEVMHETELLMKLNESEALAQTHKDAWLRAVAETENLRKRMENELVQTRRYAVEGLAAELVVVRDNLERALAAENTSAESLREGVDLTYKSLSGIFEKYHLVELNPAGEKFDPHLHQAISLIDSELPANTVVSVLQKGYRLNDRVLRPALVMVSKG
ncbi:MAG TPA: nucleotide exchange factor GrpE [Burkholderiales bacterium]|nr:nucleotide exchange factor GrpE [Burkholderiales bacterium]